MVALTENRTGLPMEIHWTERIAPPPSIQAYHQAYRYNCMHGTQKLKNVFLAKILWNYREIFLSQTEVTPEQLMQEMDYCISNCFFSEDLDSFNHLFDLICNKNANGMNVSVSCFYFLYCKCSYTLIQKTIQIAEMCVHWSLNYRQVPNALVFES